MKTPTPFFLIKILIAFSFPVTSPIQMKARSSHNCYLTWIKTPTAVIRFVHLFICKTLEKQFPDELHRRIPLFNGRHFYKHLWNSIQHFEVVFNCTSSDDLINTWECELKWIFVVFIHSFVYFWIMLIALYWSE